MKLLKMKSISSVHPAMRHYRKHLTNENEKIISFSDLLESWMFANNLKHKGATEYKYRYMIDTHIKPAIGSIPVDKINSQIINEFIHNKLTNGRLDKKGGLSPSYVRSMTVIIQSAIKHGVDLNVFQPSSVKIYKPPIEKKKIRVLSIAEQKHLEAELFNDPDATKIGILLSLYTGLRIGEVCALKWEDVNFKREEIYINSTVIRSMRSDNKSYITIDKPKTKTSIREIPIPRVLLSVLIRAKELSKSPFVISDNDNFVNPRTYEYRFHKLIKKAGLPAINYHALRHTFATRCVEAGVDIKTLSELLGHSSVATTMDIYVHSSMEQKRHQLEKLTNLFFSE